ncbi:hypothetical protein [Bacillus pumilus]|uniref:hypothetical protein n=1 Tax=Bacillus pumilus TaxID=1408 RepID=UPI000D026D06|nr:hypothetical protein [Bacillus pumilus]PRS29901.1 hypothetical protein C6X99_01795 [Bacillus pumilus]UDF15750.1 hypothetical protein LG951_14925 [Bacillus pumilus]
MKQIVKGDWVEVVGQDDREGLYVLGYVLETTGGNLLIKSRFGRMGVYPEDWAKNLDVTVTEAGLKDLIDMSLDIKDKHLFEMYTRDLQALQSK